MKCVKLSSRSTLDSVKNLKHFFFFFYKLLPYIEIFPHHCGEQRSSFVPKQQSEVQTLQLHLLFLSSSSLCTIKYFCKLYTKLFCLNRYNTSGIWFTVTCSRFVGKIFIVLIDYTGFNDLTVDPVLPLMLYSYLDDV